MFLKEGAFYVEIPTMIIGLLHFKNQTKITMYSAPKLMMQFLKQFWSNNDFFWFIPNISTVGLFASNSILIDIFVACRAINVLSSILNMHVVHSPEYLCVCVFG